MEPYEPTLHAVYKGLERPALYLGLPIPLLFCVGALFFLLGAFIYIWLWFAIPISIYLLSLLSKKDAHIFNLLYLKFKTRGNRRANLYYKARAIFAQSYESVPLFTLVHYKFNDHEAQ